MHLSAEQNQDYNVTKTSGGVMDGSDIISIFPNYTSISPKFSPLKGENYLWTYKSVFLLEKEKTKEVEKKNKLIKSFESNLPV